MRNQKLYDTLKKREELNMLSDFDKDLLRDWGNEEIFGPWTDLEEGSKFYKNTGKFKFYKSYYLVDIGNEPANIEPLY